MAVDENPIAGSLRYPLKSWCIFGYIVPNTAQVYIPSFIPLVPQLYCPSSWFHRLSFGWWGKNQKLLGSGLDTFPHFPKAGPPCFSVTKSVPVAAGGSSEITVLRPMLEISRSCSLSDSMFVQSVSTMVSTWYSFTLPTSGPRLQGEKPVRMKGLIQVPMSFKPSHCSLSKTLATYLGMTDISL